ncbi:hypothetical protein DPX16_20182 [Anabarilius grahami]|uniref:Uncharacterized protein n=1 Tax=Anabarilius grahami TaxID=495550 RepID=A0A3N0XE70_ANAGA|nr:hypothetical protein DPX16_20182 [Anabarilius grahami]
MEEEKEVFLSELEDEELRKMYWIGASYYGPSELPDTTGLNWKEAMLKCVEFKRPRSRTLPNPVPNQRPTADGDDDPAVTSEPAPGGATELDIIPEPEVFPAEKFESGVPSSVEGVESPSLPSLTPTKSAVLSELSRISPATPPSPLLSDVVTSRDYCEPSPPGLEYPVAPPPASVLVSPPRPVALTPSPMLLPPSSSAGTFEPSASRSCLGPSASPGSDVTSLAQQTLLLSGPPPLLALPQAAPPPPSVAPATPQP